LAAARRNFIAELCTPVAAAGFRVAQILPSSLLLLRTFRHHYPEVRDRALLVHIGARSTHLTFVEGDRFFVRTLAFGGNRLTLEVAEELKIEFATAEKLKLQVFSSHPASEANRPERITVQAAAERFGLHLQQEATRSIASYRRWSGAEAPAIVYLAGGGSLLPDLPQTLAEKLSLPVERFEPLRGVEIPAAMSARALEEAAPFLVDLVGLAVPEKSLLHLNLLPPSLVAGLAFRQRQPLLITATILGAAALAPIAGYYRRLATVTAEKIMAVEQRLQPLRALAARNADNLAWIANAQKQIATLKRLAEAKSNWTNFITELQTCLDQTEDVWLEKLRIAPPTPASGAAEAVDAELQLALSGCLLDRNNPTSKVSENSYARVQSLQRLLGQSQYVTAVKNERFDNSQPGILRFDFTLVVDSRRSL